MFGNIPNILGWFGNDQGGTPVTGGGTTNTVTMWTSATTIGDSKITQNAAGSNISFVPVASTTGAITNFNFTQPANTGQTTTAEIFGSEFGGGSRQWATGAITTQRENYFKTTTYSFVGASTITNAYGAYFEAPTAGTNATITNNWAAGFSGNVNVSGKINLGITTVSSPSNGNFWYDGGDSPTHYGFNFYSNDAGDLGSIFKFGNSSTYFSYYADHAGNNYFYVPLGQSMTFSNDDGASANFYISNNQQYTWYTRNLSTPVSGVHVYSFTGAVFTNQAASVEISPYGMAMGTIQYSTGTLSRQRGLVVDQPSISFLGASSVTEAATISVAGPVIVGTNGTCPISSGISIGSILPLALNTNVVNGYGAYCKAPTGAQNNYSAAFLNGNFGIGTASPAGLLSITQTATATGTIKGIVYTGAINTNQTTTTEINGLLFTTAGRQWATGAIGTQREFYITTPTYSFVGASTITNAYTFYAVAPTAGTNATITNNYAAGFDGNLALITAGNKLHIKEGTNGSLGQTTLVAGTKAISITGITTATRAFVQLVTPNGVSLTVQYQAVCTAGTLTIQANIAAGTINVSDVSVLNYVIIQPTP